MNRLDQSIFQLTLLLLASLTGTSGPNEGIFLAQSADRPMYTISDTTKVDYLDKSFHFPGKVTWNQVKIKFVDTTGGATGINVAQKSFDYLGQAGFLNAGSIAGKSDSTAMATISKGKATRQIGVLSVDVLNSDGGVVDSWALNNPFITSMTSTSSAIMENLTFLKNATELYKTSQDSFGVYNGHNFHWYSSF